MSLKKSTSKLDESKQSDLHGIDAAMKRAALRAREMARVHRTAIVTMKNGKIIRDYPK